MWYLTVLDEGICKVVSDDRGRPRLFPKTKKANNFVAGRPQLDAREPNLVTDISNIPGRLKVWP